MTFSQAVGDALSKYATFRGRSPRSAYWWWYQFTVIVLAIAYAIVADALFLPNLAVTVRRFHDAVTAAG